MFKERNLETYEKISKESYHMPSIRYDIGDLGSYIKALYSIEENPFDI